MGARQWHTGITMSVAAASMLALPVSAQAPAPDLEFLEYLGSFEESDEAWYVDVQIEELEHEGEPEARERAPELLGAEHYDD